MFLLLESGRLQNSVMQTFVELPYYACLKIDDDVTDRQLLLE